MLNILREREKERDNDDDYDDDDGDDGCSTMFFLVIVFNNSS